MICVKWGQLTFQLLQHVKQHEQKQYKYQELLEQLQNQEQEEHPHRQQEHQPPQERWRERERWGECHPSYPCMLISHGECYLLHGSIFVLSKNIILFLLTVTFLPFCVLLLLPQLQRQQQLCQQQRQMELPSGPAVVFFVRGERPGAGGTTLSLTFSFPSRMRRSSNFGASGTGGVFLRH